MKRRLFNLAAGLSLLVCLVLVAALVGEPSLRLGSYDLGLQTRVHYSDVESDLEIAMYRNYGVSIWHLPALLLVIVAALLPAMWVDRKLRQRRELRKGLCRICGYDLRATPHRCPECGTPVPGHPLQ